VAKVSKNIAVKIAAFFLSITVLALSFFPLLGGSFALLLSEYNMAWLLVSGFAGIAFAIAVNPLSPKFIPKLNSRRNYWSALSASAILGAIPLIATFVIARSAADPLAPENRSGTFLALTQYSELHGLILGDDESRLYYAKCFSLPESTAAYLTARNSDRPPSAEGLSPANAFEYMIEYNSIAYEGRSRGADYEKPLAAFSQKNPAQEFFVHTILKACKQNRPSLPNSPATQDAPDHGLMSRNSIGPATVQTAQNRPVQLPIDMTKDKERAFEAIQLAICANLNTPHEGAPLTSGKSGTARAVMASAEKCMASVEHAVLNGTISDFPAMTLALRNTPFFDPKGTDRIAETLDDIASLIATKPASTMQFDYYGASLRTGPIRKPFTSQELAAAANVYRRGALPDILASRSIPIDPSTSYVVTAADVVIHPTRYKAEGRTLEETLDDARKLHTSTEDKKLAKLCMINDGHMTLQRCQTVSARNTLEMIVNKQVKHYNPAFYK
jgi:hypothetical protein